MTTQVELYKSGNRTVSSSDDTYTIVIVINGKITAASLTATEWSKLLANPKSAPNPSAGG